MHPIQEAITGKESYEDLSSPYQVLHIRCEVVQSREILEI